MFYTFKQNNSGGHFSFDEEDGITHYVIVEADSNAEAIRKAIDIGIYFNGVEDGADCGCCGDRWCDYVEGEAYPSIYGRDATTTPIKDLFLMRWMDVGKEACIHYKDGRKVWV